MNSSETILKTKNITKKFNGLIAVDGVSFDIKENEIIGLIGPNGAGKTTFFNILTGGFIPDSGKVYYKNKDITELSPEQRVSLGIARTFQLTSTFDNLKVIDNIKLACYRLQYSPSVLGMCLHRLDSAISEKIEKCLITFGLNRLANRYAGELSLGEKRILEIAMALVIDPEVLLLDEPFAGLSEAEIDEVLMTLKEHAKQQTIVIVEHKISKITDLVERVGVMVEGKIIAVGKVEEVLEDPQVRKSYWGGV
ncbi:MAG: branched-chain amino acid transport system ATP-binding protein [Candidatus Atribacteria bacterium]|nr:branched-chain amino acid transport system ATP-binding protein [Candidatus Atribacteria bacterium]